MSNKFNVGDRIAVIDDNLEGYITHIENNNITINVVKAFTVIVNTNLRNYIIFYLNKYF